MFLIGVLSFLLAAGVVQDSTATTGGEVYFRWNKYRYEASYMNNAEAAKGIRKILEDGISGSDITACDAECKRLDSTLSGLKSDLDAARAQAAIVFGTSS